MATTKKAAKATTRSQRGRLTTAEGPRYRVLSESFIDQRLVKAGEEIVYFGQPGSQLKPLNAEAKARKEAVRAVRVHPDLDADEKLEQLRELSDDWNGVEKKDDFAESESDLETDDLPDAHRAELERQALAGQASLDDDTNRVGVKLQGHNEPTPSELQGATPVLDAQGKTEKVKAEVAKGK